MIRIVTDSSSDLPAEVVDARHISVVPLTIRFGDEEMTDRVDLDPAAFWARLAASEALPETAAPSVGAFLETYRRLVDDGATGIVSVCLSSRLSATYQSAVLAAERLDDVPIKVVDSKTVTMALGLQVMAASEAAESGGTVDDVAEAALAAAASTSLLAALDTLEFLKRGGRIGGAQALVGNLLDIKPLIAVDDGVVAAAGRVRTRGKAITTLARKIADVADDLRALAVLHGSAPDLDRLVHAVKAAAPDIEPVIAELGPVVGTHAGPGTIGVAYQLG